MTQTSAFHFESLVWDWPIAIYLFLIGISAGLVTLAVLLRRVYPQAGGADSTLLRTTLIVGPGAAILGLLILVFHLTRPWTFWKLMFHYSFTSVMSMGVMLFQLYMVVLVLWQSSGNYRPLFGARENVVTSDVVAALEADGLKYRLHPDSGQVLVAASRTAPGRSAHSLHVYYLRAGDARKPVEVQVDAARDGGTLATRRITARQDSEFIEKIIVPRATSDWAFRAYKVSKRWDDDISAVCLALHLDIADGVVRRASIGAGGVAATPARARQTEALLTGQPWTEALAQRAGEALQAEFTPISDMRASGAYRRTVLAGLMRRYWLESQGQTAVSLEDFSLADCAPQEEAA